MLTNGILQNSEVLPNLRLDECLLRSLFKAHSKASLDFPHPETGTKPIRFVIAVRKLTYLKIIQTGPKQSR